MPEPAAVRNPSIRPGPNKPTSWLKGFHAVTPGVSSPHTASSESFCGPPAHSVAFQCAPRALGATGLSTRLSES